MPVEEAEKGTCNPEKVFDWLNQEKDGECRPCALATAVGMYQDVLEEAGATDQLGKLDVALKDEKDPVGEIAKFMDEVKEVVDPEVSLKLRAIDCEAQSSHPENVEEE
jgi:hypothetical protein